jgi:hypothetical protein
MWKGSKTMAKLAKGIFMIVIVLAISMASLGLTFSRSEACREIRGNIGLRLMIRDQAKGYGRSVSDTWTASDMWPGQVLPCEGSFIELKQLSIIPAQHMQINVSYNCNCGACITGDAMAKQLIITRLEYVGSGWSINLLSGGASGRPPRPSGYHSGDWSIMDVDGDGNLTFFDFKNSGLRNLPAPVLSYCDVGTKKMLMSITFSDAAGNEFQAAELDFRLIFTLN